MSREQDEQDRLIYATHQGNPDKQIHIWGQPEDGVGYFCTDTKNGVLPTGAHPIVIFHRNCEQAGAAWICLDCGEINTEVQA